MERFVFLLILFLLNSIPGMGQMTVDTSAVNREKLKMVYNSAKTDYPDFMVMRRKTFTPIPSTKVFEWSFVYRVWNATKKIPQGLRVEGVGIGRNQRESVNAALEDLGLKMDARVRTQVKTTNRNGRQDLNSITIANTDFFIPKGVTSISTEKIKRKHYRTIVVIDISAYLAEVEERVARLHHTICLALGKMEYKSQEEKERFLVEGWNAFCLGAYKILNNPISNRWSAENTQRKDNLIEKLDLRYGVMYATPETCDPYKTLPKVYPCTYAELEIICNRERRYIEHMELPAVTDIEGYWVYYKKNYNCYTAQERLSKFGWKTH